MRCQEASPSHLCVWLWGGGWSVPDESMNNTQAELADRKMYTLSFICKTGFDHHCAAH